VYVPCTSTATLAGLSLIAAPRAFNATFAAPAARFEDPDILSGRPRGLLRLFEPLIARGTQKNLGKPACR
jgi:hypothetical protein